MLFLGKKNFVPEKKIISLKKNSFRNFRAIQKFLKKIRLENLFDGFSSAPRSSFSGSVVDSMLESKFSSDFFSI